MTRAAKILLDEALQLTPAERSDLAAELIASLDGDADSDVEEAWAVEIERRVAQVETGESAGRPWPEVREEILRDLSRR